MSDEVKQKKLCEVSIHFKVPKDKMQHLFNARDELFKAGITFDTGGTCDEEYFYYDWEFDWSLKGNVGVEFGRDKPSP